MKKILLIRHVETEGNTELRYVGKMNSPISEYGKIQLEGLKNYFKNRKIDKVYSSPSERAIITAKSFYDDLIIDERFREMDFGKCEGMTHKEIQIAYPNLINSEALKKDEFSFPEGDSIKTFYDRTSVALKSVIDKTKDGEVVAIISHGGVIRMLLSYLISESKNQFWRFHINNASITTICIDEDFPIIHRINEIIDNG